MGGNVIANSGGAGVNGGTITLIADAGSIKVSNVSSQGATLTTYGTVQVSAASGITQYGSTEIIDRYLRLISTGGNVVFAL